MKSNYITFSTTLLHWARRSSTRTSKKKIRLVDRLSLYMKPFLQAETRLIDIGKYSKTMRGFQSSCNVSQPTMIEVG